MPKANSASKKSAVLTRQSLYHNLQKMVRSPVMRNILAKLEASTSQRKTRELETPKSKSIYQALLAQGHTEDIKPLNDLQIKEMRDYLVGQQMLDYNGTNLKPFVLSEVPNSCSTAYYPTETLVRTPHLFTLANNPDVLAAIENIFGCKPQIGVIQALWRFPNNEPPVNDEFWHRDFETLRFIKCFLYLTDVTMNSGPHKFIESSHRNNRYWKLGPGLAKDESLEKAYGKEAIVTKIGPAGTCFLEETNGWHKGTKPVNAPRLMIQVVYSINPVRYRDNKPISRHEIKDDGMEKYDEYTFQNHILPSGSQIKKEVA